MKTYYVKLKSGGYKIVQYKNMRIARINENIKTRYNVDLVRPAKQEEIDIYNKEQERTTI